MTTLKYIKYEPYFLFTCSLDVFCQQLLRFSGSRNSENPHSFPEHYTHHHHLVSECLSHDSCVFVFLQTGTGSGTMTECGVSCQCPVTPSCWTRWSARRRASSSGPRSRPDPSPRSSSTRTSRTADVGPSDSRRSGWVLYQLPLLYRLLWRFRTRHQRLHVNAMRFHVPD